MPAGLPHRIGHPRLPPAAHRRRARVRLDDHARPRAGIRRRQRSRTCSARSRAKAAGCPLQPGAGPHRRERRDAREPAARPAARDRSRCSGRRWLRSWAARSASTRPGPRSWSRPARPPGSRPRSTPRSPGAFFALEEILGSLAVGAFPPVVVASVVAAVVSHSFLGNNPAFPIPVEYGFALKREVFVFYPFLGMVAGVVAALFIRVYFGTETLIAPARNPRWHAALARRGDGGHAGAPLERPAGGARASGRAPRVFRRMSGVVARAPGVGQHRGHLDHAQQRRLGRPVHALALCRRGHRRRLRRRSSPASFPTWGFRPEAYALVGMGALVAAATAAPITGILLVFEMTNDYEIVLPLMLTTVIANLVARRIEPDSLYSGWLRRRGERLEHGTDRDVLAGSRVAAAFDPAPQVVGEDASMRPAAGSIWGAAPTPTCRWWTRSAGWSASSRWPTSAASPESARSHSDARRLRSGHTGRDGGARGQPARRRSGRWACAARPRFRWSTLDRSPPRPREPGAHSRALRASRGRRRQLGEHPRRFPTGRPPRRIPAMPAHTFDALLPLARRRACWHRRTTSTAPKSSSRTRRCGSSSTARSTPRCATSTSTSARPASSIPKRSSCSAPRSR